MGAGVGVFEELSERLIERKVSASDLLEESNFRFLGGDGIISDKIEGFTGSSQISSFNEFLKGSIPIRQSSSKSGRFFLNHACDFGDQR